MKRKVVVRIWIEVEREINDENITNEKELTNHYNNLDSEEEI